MSRVPQRMRIHGRGISLMVGALLKDLRGALMPLIYSSIHLIETPQNMSTSRTLKSNMGRNSHTTATHRLQFKWHWNIHEICKLQHKEYHNTHSPLIPWATHMIPHCPVAQTHIEWNSDECTWNRIHKRILVEHNMDKHTITVQNKHVDSRFEQIQRYPAHG